MDEETKSVAQQFYAQFQRIYAQLQRNAGYLARQEINVILEAIRSDPKRLEPFGFKVYSQNDEDGIIEQIFQRLNTAKGQFCEIGVESGLESNTLYLIHKGWRGSWIEGNIKRRDGIENKFASLIRNRRLRVHFELATAENINDLFQKVSFNSEELDFLSIDIDGNDIYLMEAIKFRPKVICIEYNAKFPPQISKKQTYNPKHFWHGTDYMGSSLLALNDVASKKGYTLVGTNITGVNAFFVRNDCIKSNFSEKYLY